MPRISPREGSRTYKVGSALTQLPLLPTRLPGWSGPSQLRSSHAFSRTRLQPVCTLPSAGATESCLLSALSLAGFGQLRRPSVPPKVLKVPNRNSLLQGGLQRRWLSACGFTGNQSKTRSAKSVVPTGKTETASSPKTHPLSPQVEHDILGGDGLIVQGSPFKPFYEERDYGHLSADHDTQTEGEGPRIPSNAPSHQSKACIPNTEQRNAANPDDLKEAPAEAPPKEHPEFTEYELHEQLDYLRTVRELEKSLDKARHNLHVSMKRGRGKRDGTYWNEEAYQDQEQILKMDLTKVKMIPSSRAIVKLKKEDFLGLVDLYFYSHRSRFLSEAPDSSPTPLQLDDYSFKVSEDFTPPTNAECDLVCDEEGTPVSPLFHVEAEIKGQKLNEIKVLQKFIDLLLDDYSPLKALFQAYKALPQPGVSYLSSGIIRLFLQRMSTPWRTSENAMVRYLSLLDDMQVAGLPITAWEWSSAIYLAGRSFQNVSNTDVAAAFRVWRQMEKEAQVAPRDVTFNILFDIAVKAEKFVLAEEVLREMHARGFRLNRLGRVSLMYYYGKKGDGDGVRKAYRDFVEAGEIVDTLVLNCVMASLINAQEPAAAEQIYERMKGMQERLRRDTNAEQEEALFLRYPPPGPDKLGTEMASNSLGRVLLKASRLKTTLPEHHAELQNIMPLTPDAITFRTLLSHHAKTSGNIDRVTVLLDDMTRQFRIPISNLTFQFLFKGFAMHGGSDRSDAKWTQQRLQIAWAACMICMKAGKTKEVGTSPKAGRFELPTVKDAEAMAAEEEDRANEQASRRPKAPRPTAWETFIKQFATPYPETKPFHLYSSSIDSSQPPGDEEEEGGSGEEYQLPKVDLVPNSASAEETATMNAIRPNKHLVLWVIRAFTRCTANRTMMEDVWYQLKQIWRPSDLSEKAVAIRELRRALRYCDTHGRK